MKHVRLNQRVIIHAGEAGSTTGVITAIEPSGRCRVDLDHADTYLFAMPALLNEAPEATK